MTLRYNVQSGAVAHRLEQAAHNHLVDGSIPSSPTMELIFIKNSSAGSFCYKDNPCYSSNNMSGTCEGEPCRGVGSLFNADLQALDGFEDRADWTVLSPNIAVCLG